MKTFEQWFSEAFHGLTTVDREGYFSKAAWNACQSRYEQRLKEAEEVIAYYANYSTWMVSTSSDMFDSVKSEDLEACEGIFNNPEHDIGGKRAREYQSKFLTKDKS